MLTTDLIGYLAAALTTTKKRPERRFFVVACTPVGAQG
jgi:hypothetical protein